MDLDDYNKRDRDNDEAEARYAESVASERFSEASSLPGESAPGLATPEGIALPEALNSKILMARGIALACTGVSDKETREAENGHQIMLMNRAVRMVVCGPGEEDLKNLRPVLAELGMWVINTTDFCGMDIKDPKGKSWHAYDWGSNDGLNHSKSHNRIAVWLHGAQVPLYAMEIKRGPYKAWQKVKDIPGALKFLGGKRSAPKNSTGTKCYAMSRAPVGPDAMKPRFPAAHLEMDRGIVVVGAHQTPAIANALQRQVKAIVDEAFPKDDRLSPTTYGVPYHTLFFCFFYIGFI
jgi:hypothetical protein